MSDYPIIEDFSPVGSTDRRKFYEFIDDSYRRVSIGYMLFLSIALMFAVGVYFLTKRMTYGSIWPNQYVYYSVLVGHVLYRLKYGRTNILSPDMLFVVFYTMFHLGYVTLYSLNLVPLSDYIFYFEQSIPRAMFVVNLGLLGFLFGYELMGARVPIIHQRPPIILPKHSWEIFGIMLMVMAITMHFVGLTLLGWGTILRYGYWAIQAAGRFTSFRNAAMISFSTPLMTIAITIYITASALRHGKLFHSKFALILSCFFILISLLEGERGSVVKFTLPLMLVRHFFVKRIKARYLAIMFIGILILFAGLAQVRTIVFNPRKMLQEYKYLKQAGELGWQSAFIEAGGSFLVVNITTQDVPTYEPYWLGESWRDAVIHIVPFMQGIVMRMGLAQWSPSQWITVTYFGPDAAGRGFTVAAEGYLNFGFPGAFIEVMLVGMFIRWLMIFFSRKPSAMRAIIMLGCLGPAVLVARNHFNLLLNPCSRVIVLAWLLNMFLGNEPCQEYDQHMEYASY